MTTSPPPNARSFAWVFLCLFAFGASFIAVAIPRTDPIAPFDGLVYADAFDRAMSGQVAVRGDQVGRASFELVACSPLFVRGTFPYVYAGEWTCGSDEPPPVLASAAWIHPPTAFFLDALIAKFLSMLSSSIAPFTASRMAGALWFALGGTLTVAFAALWGAPLWRSTAVIAAFLPTPLFFAIFSYTTPDRFSLIAGSLVMIAGTLWWRRKRGAAWLFLAGLMSGGMFKQTFILADIGLVALIAALWWQARRTGAELPRARSVVTGMSALLAGGAAGVLGWHALKHQLGIPLPARTAPDPFTVVPGLDGAIRLLYQHAYLTPLGDTLPIMLEPGASIGIAVMLTLAAAGAAIGAVLYRRLADRVFPLGLAALLTLGPGALAISILGGASSGNWLPGSPRYALAAFPLYVLPLLVAAERRVVWIGGACLAAVGMLAWAVFPLR